MVWHIEILHLFWSVEKKLNGFDIEILRLFWTVKKQQNCTQIKYKIKGQEIMKLTNTVQEIVRYV